MLRKFLGGLAFLALVIVFAVPTLVVVTPADATPTRIHRQPYTRYYVCNGYVVGSESGTRETTYDFDHPPDTVTIKIVEVWHPVRGPVNVIEREVSHTDHGVTEIYNSTRIIEYDLADPGDPGYPECR